MISCIMYSILIDLDSIILQYVLFDYILTSIMPIVFQLGYAFSW